MTFQKFIARKAFVAELIELLQLNTDAHGAVCINTNSVEKLDSFYDQLDQYDQDKSEAREYDATMCIVGTPFKVKGVVTFPGQKDSNPKPSVFFLCEVPQ